MINISVVVPLYNKEKHLERCLSSIFCQTLRPSEVLVVDDGSTDGSLSVAKRFSDFKGFKIIEQKNSGVSDARNAGIYASSSEYIAFIDADDCWHQDHLENLHKLVEKFKKCDFFTTRSTSLMTNIGQESGKLRLVTDYPSYVIDNGWVVNSSTVMARACLWKKTGGFPSGKNLGEDISTWLKLSLHSDLAVYDVFDTYYESGDPLSLSKSNSGRDDYFIEYAKEILAQGVELNREALSEILNKMLISRSYHNLAVGDNARARKFACEARRTKRFRRQFIACYIVSVLPSFFGVAVCNARQKMISRES